MPTLFFFAISLQLALPKLNPNCSTKNIFCLCTRVPLLLIVLVIWVDSFTSKHAPQAALQRCFGAVGRQPCSPTGQSLFLQQVVVLVGKLANFKINTEANSSNKQNSVSLFCFVTFFNTKSVQDYLRGHKLYGGGESLCAFLNRLPLGSVKLC